MIPQSSVVLVPHGLEASTAHTSDRSACLQRGQCPLTGAFSRDFDYLVWTTLSVQGYLRGQALDGEKLFDIHAHTT